MQSLRPLRPTVQELAAFLLQTKPQTRCLLRTAQQNRSRPPPSPRSLIDHTYRTFSTSLSQLNASPKPKTHDRGPRSTEDTQTDFGNLDVLGNTPPPSTSVDACLSDGFHLDNGLKITDGDGVLLVGGEAFTWRPWEANGTADGKKRLVNEKGQWDVDDEAWGLFELVWPKPDLLILGLGKDMRPISPRTRQHINSLGIRVDIQDTRNAAAQFNLLATERGVGSVAAALIPIGFREGSNRTFGDV